MSNYNGQQRIRAAEDVLFNGESFRELDSRIISVRLIEEAAEDTTQWGQRAAIDGQILLSARRIKKTLTVEFALNVLYDYAEKVQILDKVNAWARSVDAGFLQASTQTVQPRIGQTDIYKKIMVRCSKFAAPGDAWAYDTKYRLDFETLGTPNWIDADELTILPDSSMSGDFGEELLYVIGGRGNAPAPIAFSIAPSSGSMRYVMMRLNASTALGLQYKNYYYGTLENGSLNDDTGANLDVEWSRVRTAGYIDLPGGVYKLNVTVSGSIATQYWIYVYQAGSHEYIKSETLAVNAWTSNGGMFAVRDNRSIRILWKGASESIDYNDITAVKIEDQTEHCETAMVYVLDGMKGISGTWDYKLGALNLTMTDASGAINPWTALTSKSADSLFTSGSTNTLKINTDSSSAAVTLNWRGWFV